MSLDTDEFRSATVLHRLCKLTGVGVASLVPLVVWRNDIFLSVKIQFLVVPLQKQKLSLGVAT